MFRAHLRQHLGCHFLMFEAGAMFERYESSFILRMFSWRKSGRDGVLGGEKVINQMAIFFNFELDCLYLDFGPILLDHS